MKVATLNSHFLSVCECCDELLIATCPQSINDKYDQHLADNPRCREWHGDQSLAATVEMFRKVSRGVTIDYEDNETTACPHCGGEIKW